MVYVLSDGTATFAPGISSRVGSTSTFEHSGLKSMDSQSSSSQAVSATRQYDAFGNLASSTGTWSGPFGYGGGFGYQEDATGLKLLGHRFYDSSTGRFLSRDPIADGRNWYLYCSNDPVNGADPYGFGWIRVVASISGAVIGGLLSGGNPIGAGIGAGLGGSLGSALEQYSDKGEVDPGEVIRDGVVDGVTTYVGGKLLVAIAAKLMPLEEVAPGLVRAIHYTTPEAAETIAREGFKDGVIYAWPKPVPKIVNFFLGSGSNSGDTIILSVPREQVKRNMWGAMMME